MSESLKLYKNERKHEEDKKELFEDMGSVARNNNQEVGIACSAFAKYDSVIGENSEIEIVTRMQLDGRTIDYMWPNKFEGQASVWGVDEEFAACLTGMVLALKPKIILETGTNKGRSTRALVDGLVQNDGHELPNGVILAQGEKGVIYNIDIFDPSNVDSTSPHLLFVIIVCGDFTLEPNLIELPCLPSNTTSVKLLSK